MIELFHRCCLSHPTHTPIATIATITTTTAAAATATITTTTTSRSTSRRGGGGGCAGDIAPDPPEPLQELWTQRHSAATKRRRCESLRSSSHTRA
jgi:hypothetical protein